MLNRRQIEFRGILKAARICQRWDIFPKTSFFKTFLDICFASIKGFEAMSKNYPCCLQNTRTFYMLASLSMNGNSHAKRYQCMNKTFYIFYISAYQPFPLNNCVYGACLEPYTLKNVDMLSSWKRLLGHSFLMSVPLPPKFNQKTVCEDLVRSNLVYMNFSGTPPDLANRLS